MSQMRRGKRIWLPEQLSKASRRVSVHSPSARSRSRPPQPSCAPMLGVYSLLPRSVCATGVAADDGSAAAKIHMALTALARPRPTRRRPSSHLPGPSIFGANTLYSEPGGRHRDQHSRDLLFKCCGRNPRSSGRPNPRPPGAAGAPTTTGEASKKTSMRPFRLPWHNTRTVCSLAPQLLIRQRPPVCLEDLW